MPRALLAILGSRQSEKKPSIGHSPSSRIRPAATSSASTDRATTIRSDVSRLFVKETSINVDSADSLLVINLARVTRDNFVRGNHERCCPNGQEGAAPVGKEKWSALGYLLAKSDKAADRNRRPKPLLQFLIHNVCDLRPGCIG
jgi:hypothetical protein